jgi:hypothetical protein
MPFIFTPWFRHMIAVIEKNCCGIFEFHLILYLSRAFLKNANKEPKNGSTGNEPGIWQALQSPDCA